MIAGVLVISGAFSHTLDGKAALPEHAEEIQTEKSESSEKIYKPQPLALQLKEVLALELKMDASRGEKGQEALRAEYKEAVILAVTGGYDRASGRENGYAYPDEDQLDSRMVDYYRDFVEANGEGRTTAIVKRYIELLEEGDYRIDKRVQEFYRSLLEFVETWSRTEVGGLGYWLLKWELGKICKE